MRGLRVGRIGFILVFGFVAVTINACASPTQTLPTIAPTTVAATSVLNNVRPTLPPTWTPAPTFTPPGTETPVSTQTSTINPTMPAWANNNLIAYVGTVLYSGQKSPSTDIFLFDLDTGIFVNLTNDIHEDEHPYWSADGTQIVYNSKGRFPLPELDQLYTISVNGGERQWVDTNILDDIINPAWSPDGNSILFEQRTFGEGDRDIFLFNMASPTREVTRLTDDRVNQFATAWSPDGLRFAMTVGREFDETEIHVSNADGSNSVNLSPVRADDLYPAWSPDGRYIAFTSDRQQRGNYDIYVMNADGSDVRRLTEEPTRDLNPSWSPDGRDIVFSADKKLTRISADGSGVSFYKVDGVTPAWRPKPGTAVFLLPTLTPMITMVSNAVVPSPLPVNLGRNSIIFESFSEALPIHPVNGRDLYLLNLNTSEVINFTNRPGHERNPAWSPDGNWLAFDSYGHDEKSARSDIFIMSADGSVVRQLTTAGGESAVWSPDGTRIAFVSLMDKQSNQIYVMNADGSNIIPITDNPFDDYEPSWSPDSQQIVFQSTADRRYHNIFIVNADGTDLRQITRQPGNYIFPVWSPDGQHIALVSGNKLSIMNIDGSNLVRLNQESSSVDGYPVWSPDGRQIVFVTKSVQLTIINADGSNMRVLTEIGGRAPAWRP